MAHTIYFKQFQIVTLQQGSQVIWGLDTNGKLWFKNLGTNNQWVESDMPEVETDDPGSAIVEAE